MQGIHITVRAIEKITDFGSIIILNIQNRNFISKNRPSIQQGLFLFFIYNFIKF